MEDVNRNHGDLFQLLKHRGVELALSTKSFLTTEESLGTHGTTVIALKYDQGVLNVADRRAIAGGTILYEEAEKILKLDDYTLIAIAGSYSQAAEAVRFLNHSVKYYARSQLQEMSLEGKLALVSRVLTQSIPSVLQGIGGFLPVVSVYDSIEKRSRIFFYDVLGARFESREYGAAGSGAEKIRGVLNYIVRTRGPFHEMPLGDVLREGLHLLDVAAGLDPATSGLSSDMPPAAKIITQDGAQDIPPEKLHNLRKELLR
jgi:proteasome beta subunit